MQVDFIQGSMKLSPGLWGDNFQTL